MQNLSSVKFLARFSDVCHLSGRLRQTVHKPQLAYDCHWKQGRKSSFIHYFQLYLGKTQCFQMLVFLIWIFKFSQTLNSKPISGDANTANQKIGLHKFLSVSHLYWILAVYKKVPLAAFNPHKRKQIRKRQNIHQNPSETLSIYQLFSYTKQNN